MGAELAVRDSRPLLEIASVEILNARPANPVLWFGIDQPVTMARVEGYAFVVSGWVLHSERRADSIQVVSDDGVIAGWGRVGLSRPDLREAFPSLPGAATCGFQFAVGAMVLPRDFTCTIEATLDDETRVSLARVRGRRAALPAPDAATLQPLIVSSLGRSGSTLLLGMLAAHPAIVVDRVAPYETRISSYWLQVFQVLSRPADHAHAGDRATFLSNSHFVGQNPFDTASPEEPAIIRAWYARTQIERLASFCRGSVDSFYRTLAKVNGQQNPLYFAEKRLTGVLSHPLADLFPDGREIFLVRDFRDVVASIFAFNAQRGYPAFGRQHFASDEEYIGRLGVWARQLHAAWKRRGGKSMLVRYEDLVTSPRDALAALLDYLNLEPRDHAIEAMISYVQGVSEPPGHRTSIDAASSIGRWRMDLDEALKNACSAAFGDLLADFGYGGGRPESRVS